MNHNLNYDDLINGQYDLDWLQDIANNATDSSENAESKDNANVNNPEFDFSLFDNNQQSTTHVTELPIWGLPKRIQEVVTDIANGYQCHRDFAVASLMGATSTILGKRISSKFGNHSNYGSLWLILVGGSSDGKSEPLKFAFKPISLLERELYKDYKKSLEIWYGSEKSDKGAKPEYIHYVINNSTDESVLHELSVNGSICWKADELRVLFDGFGKFSKNGGGTIVGNLLSIFNNIDVSISRVTQDPRYIENPNLSIIGGIQPSRLKETMENKGFMEDGFFQRFLYVIPDRLKSIPHFSDYTISQKTTTFWQEEIIRLSKIPESVLMETQSARQLHIDTINRWRDECEQYRDIEPMVSLIRKLEIHLCRWSMVVAILSGQHEINTDVIKYSVECMEYFKQCGEKAFLMVSNDSQKSTEPTREETFKRLQKWYPQLNQSKLAESLGISQQAISKFLK